MTLLNVRFLYADQSCSTAGAEKFGSTAASPFRCSSWPAVLAIFSQKQPADQKYYKSALPPDFSFLHSTTLLHLPDANISVESNIWSRLVTGVQRGTSTDPAYWCLLISYQGEHVATTALAAEPMLRLQHHSSSHLQLHSTGLDHSFTCCVQCTPTARCNHARLL